MWGLWPPQDPIPSRPLGVQPQGRERGPVSVCFTSGCLAFRVGCAVGALTFAYLWRTALQVLLKPSVQMPFDPAVHVWDFVSPTAQRAQAGPAGAAAT